jgi:hypothetical protein
MAPTITATLQPSTASILLTITSPGTALATLTRADANGTASVRVRDSDVFGFIPGAGVNIITTDYEPAQGSVVYTVTDSAGATATASVTFALDSPWLFVPVMPNYSSKLQTVTGYSAQVSSRSTVLAPLGKSSPTVVIRPMGTKRGSLGLWAGTYADAQGILDTLSRGEVVMLRQPEHQGQDMYFVAEDAEIQPLAVGGAGTVWGVQVGFLQVARPTGPLAAALGWDFAAVAAAAPDFATLRRQYATFEDLRLNETA